MIPLLHAPPHNSSLAARAARLAQLELTYRFQPIFRTLKGDALLAEPVRPPPSPEITRGAKGWPAYLVRLGARPLLTPAEEQQRFLRMHYARFRADQLRRHLNPRNPDPELIEQIERLVALAQAERDEIVAANTRLVIFLVRRCGASRGHFDDLLSEGLETLVRAVDQFDPGRGLRFSTYATTAVRRTLVRALQRWHRQKQRQRQLDAHLEGGIEGVNLSSRWHAGNDAEPPGREAAAPPPWEGEGNGESLVASLPWQSLLAALPPRERLVLTRRYGLDGRPMPQTLQSLASELGVCKERVRQIELKARQRLRRQIEAFGVQGLPS